MAEVNPPRWMQTGLHDAEGDRRMIGALVGRRGGVVGPDDLMVRQRTTPAMSVEVRAGAVFIPGSETANQGTYFCDHRGDPVVLPITAANPSQARLDLVIARVHDEQYGVASESRWALEVVTGTPGAGRPPIPANSWVLAEVTVGAGATSITNANIADVRADYAPAPQYGYATAPGGTRIMQSVLPALTAGDVGVDAYRRADNRGYVWDGTRWLLSHPLYTIESFEYNHGASTGWTMRRDRRNIWTAPCDGRLYLTCSGTTGFGTDNSFYVLIQSNNTTTRPMDPPHISGGHAVGGQWTAFSTSHASDYTAGQSMGYTVHDQLATQTGSQYVRATVTAMFVPAHMALT